MNRLRSIMPDCSTMVRSFPSAALARASRRLVAAPANTEPLPGSLVFWLRAKARKASGAKKSPANAGLSFQEEPSNVTFTIDASQTSATDGTRDVMAVTKMRFFTMRLLLRTDEGHTATHTLGRPRYAVR